MKTKGIVAIFVLVLPFFCGTSICNADGFDSLRCGSDVRKALLGRTMSNETIVTIEARHKDLGLKDLGASEISDRLSVISWRICGEEYVILEDQDVVRDVLKFPAVSAWKIDDKQRKFVELKTEELRCSRDGIITADGGL